MTRSWCWRTTRSWLSWPGTGSSARSRSSSSGVLKRLDVTSRSLIALIEPGSCFAGTLLEVALACDRQYMLDGVPEEELDGIDPADGEAVITAGAGQPGLLPDGQRADPAGSPGSTGGTVSWRRSPGAPGSRSTAADAMGLGLVTLAPDDLDWAEELRIALEERASLLARRADRHGGQPAVRRPGDAAKPRSSGGSPPGRTGCSSGRTRAGRTARCAASAAGPRPASTPPASDRGTEEPSHDPSRGRPAAGRRGPGRAVRRLLRRGARAAHRDRGLAGRAGRPDHRHVPGEAHLRRGRVSQRARPRSGVRAGAAGRPVPPALPAPPGGGGRDAAGRRVPAGQHRRGDHGRLRCHGHHGGHRHVHPAGTARRGGVPRPGAGLLRAQPGRVRGRGCRHRRGRRQRVRLGPGAGPAGPQRHRGAPAPGLPRPPGRPSRRSAAAPRPC